MKPFHERSYFIHKSIFSQWDKSCFHHLHLRCACRWCSSQLSLYCIWEKDSNVSYQPAQSFGSPPLPWWWFWHLWAFAPKSWNHIFQPLPIDISLLGTPTVYWKAEMSSVRRSAWNFAFLISGIKFYPFNVCIGGDASFAFWGLMKDSGWGVCGSFVTRGMPPQLTVSNTLLVPVCSQNHLSSLSSIPFLLHLPSNLLNQLQESCSYRDYLPPCSNAVFLQSCFCVFKEYMKKACVAHRLTQRTIS